jgi:hypothetical protein
MAQGAVGAAPGGRAASPDGHHQHPQAEHRRRGATRPPRIGTSATTRRIAQPTSSAATQAVGGRSSERPRIQALAP